MVGATVAVRSFTDAHSCPYLCLDSMASNSLSVMTNVDSVVRKDVSRRKSMKKLKAVHWRSSFLDTWSTYGLSCGAHGYLRKKKKLKYLSIVDELGGQYEEGFDDVKNVFSRIQGYSPAHVLHEAVSLAEESIDLVGLGQTLRSKKTSVSTSQAAGQ